MNKPRAGVREEISGEPNVSWMLVAPLRELMDAAASVRDRAYDRTVSYSRKVFIPLTKLCRNVCHYCAFAERPGPQAGPYLSPEEVLEIARRGEAAGCTEALFTLGDKPECRYAAAGDALRALGHRTTVSYLHAMCDLVLRETSLLPHTNAGVLTREEMASLREVSVSQGLMLESSSTRLTGRGQVHHGSPDKDPSVRLENIRWAGELAVPFTTGILVGIGENRLERIDALLRIRELAARYGHIQEVIVQNFRAKAGTKCANRSEPQLEDLLWTVSVARLILGPDANLQVPPNLVASSYGELIDAGINDWGGISPVTMDHVNPEAPWPTFEELSQSSASHGKLLVSRLPVYPSFALEPDRWLNARLAIRVRRAADSEGFARGDQWAPGLAAAPTHQSSGCAADTALEAILATAAAGRRLDEAQIVRLFAARGPDYEQVCRAADLLRREASGSVVRYVVNRNINYTNICKFRCRFCAFCKGKAHEELRGLPYNLDLDEIARRTREAWNRGATEVCLQGGIHPSYTGATYLAICRAVKEAMPDIHVHAFSPLEIFQGANTSGMEVGEFLKELVQVGLGSLPGTAAEILDDEVRSEISPDKISSAEWLAVVRSAHRLGLPTTATIMYGHVERPIHWARHLLAIRDLQAETGGFTEFVPLPFVHMEAPMYLRGGARKGPTFREAVLMHAVARLVFHTLIPNIQTSWVKMGKNGVAACLNAGANDLGGTLMNESISRSAGTQHGQELPPQSMEELIVLCGRIPQQRTTTYQQVAPERWAASFHAPPLLQTLVSEARKSVLSETVL